MNIQLKQRHHYVWQFYLSAWEVDGVVACKRGEQVFNTGTNNLAVRKDYYRLRELSEAERRFVKVVCMHKSEPLLQAINRGWFPLFLGPFALREYAEAGVFYSDDIREALDALIQNTGEDLHTAIERSAIDHLRNLRALYSDFLDSEDELGTFLHFVSVQFFRTPRTKSNVGAALQVVPEIRPDHVWPIMSHIFATNVSLGLLRRWDTTRVTLLRASGEDEFITADQPVINRDALGTELFEPVEEMTFYYPISPKVAFLLEPDAGRREIIEVEAGPEEVRRLNLDLMSVAHEQVYATKEALLMDLAGK